MLCLLVRQGSIKFRAFLVWYGRKTQFVIHIWCLVRDERSYVVHSFVDLCGTCEIGLHFVDLRGTRESVCILWIYVGHVNQPAFCGFMWDTWICLHFVDLCGARESVCILWIYMGHVNQSVFCGFIWDTWISLYFVDLCRTRESVGILWIYVGHVNQSAFCGFMRDMWIGLYFAVPMARITNSHSPVSKYIRFFKEKERFLFCFRCL
jgi:hypothetical protein